MRTRVQFEPQRRSSSPLSGQVFPVQTATTISEPGVVPAHLEITMFLMVHDNGGAPKWWARTGQFGRGDAWWGSMTPSRLERTTGNTSTTWVAKQKRGYELAGEVNKATVELLCGVAVGDLGDLGTEGQQVMMELRDLSRLDRRPGATTGFSALAKLASETAKSLLTVRGDLLPIWTGQNQTAQAGDAADDGIDVPPPPPVTVADMLKQLGQQDAGTATANPWEF